jgi:hypothetical protein
MTKEEIIARITELQMDIEAMQNIPFLEDSYKEKVKELMRLRRRLSSMEKKKEESTE